jgi:hypothetical protein
MTACKPAQARLEASLLQPHSQHTHKTRGRRRQQVLVTDGVASCTGCFADQYATCRQLSTLINHLNLQLRLIPLTWARRAAEIQPKGKAPCLTPLNPAETQQTNYTPKVFPPHLGSLCCQLSGGTGGTSGPPCSCSSPAAAAASKAGPRWRWMSDTTAEGSGKSPTTTTAMRCGRYLQKLL